MQHARILLLERGSCHLVLLSVFEEGVPLLANECAGSQISARRRNGQHVNTMNKVGRITEVGCIVDFVFEEYTCHLVGEEGGRVVGIGRREEEVRGEGAGLDGEHESCYSRG